MAWTSEATIVPTFKIEVAGSDAKTHSVTFPNAKTTFQMSASEQLSGTAALFGNDNGASRAIHDVTNRITFKFT